MKALRNIHASLIGFLLLFVWARAAAQVPEIAVPNLPDVCMAALRPDGSAVIYYNPVLVQQINAVCPQYLYFAKAHEYGHINLGHLVQGMYTQNPYAHMLQAQQAEIQADLYGTDYWVQNDPQVIVVAVIFMLQHPNNGDWTHMPSNVRVQMIIARAKQQGVVFPPGF